jgi:hypothetical protein
VWFNAENRLHRLMKSVFEKTDWDERIQWHPTQGQWQVEVFDKSYQGFLAFKKMILYSPFSYFCYVFVLGLPNEYFLWIKLKAVQFVLVAFFPWPEVIESLKAATVTRRLAQGRIS